MRVKKSATISYMTVLEVEEIVDTSVRVFGGCCEGN